MGSIHKASLLLLSTTLLVGFSLSARAGDGRIEHWVPADEAVIDGEVQAHRFSSPHVVPRIDGVPPGQPPRKPSRGGLLADGRPWGRDDCDSLIISMGGRDGDPIWPRQAIAKSTMALLGTVTSSEPGFFRSTLYELVTVEVDRTIRWPEDRPEPREVRFFVDRARILIGDRALCSAGNRDLSPVVGNRVLITASKISNEDPLLLYVTDQGLFFEDYRHEASIPGARIEDLPPQWEALEKDLVESPRLP